MVSILFMKIYKNIFAYKRSIFIYITSGAKIILMNLGGLFDEPIEFYHGRIPFILVDLITQLKKLNSKNSREIFNPNCADDALNYLISHLKSNKIYNWSIYTSISRLSVSLVIYLNCLTRNEPLISKNIQSRLLSINFDNKKMAVSTLRNVLVDLYPGRYRTLLYITNYLREINIISEERFIKIFGKPLFGSEAIQRNKPFFKKLLIFIFQNHDSLFSDAVLGQAAFLTDKQIKGLIKKHIRGVNQSNTKSALEKSSSEMKTILLEADSNQKNSNFKEVKVHSPTLSMKEFDEFSNSIDFGGHSKFNSSSPTMKTQKFELSQLDSFFDDEVRLPSPISKTTKFRNQDLHSNPINRINTITSPGNRKESIVSSFPLNNNSISPNKKYLEKSTNTPPNSPHVKRKRSPNKNENNGFYRSTSNANEFILNYKRNSSESDNETSNLENISSFLKNKTIDFPEDDVDNDKNDNKNKLSDVDGSSFSSLASSSSPPNPKVQNNQYFFELDNSSYYTSYSSEGEVHQFQNVNGNIVSKKEITSDSFSSKSLSTLELPDTDSSDETTNHQQIKKQSNVQYFSNSKPSTPFNNFSNTKNVKFGLSHSNHNNFIKNNRNLQIDEGSIIKIHFINNDLTDSISKQKQLYIGGNLIIDDKSNVFKKNESSQVKFATNLFDNSNQSKHMKNNFSDDMDSFSLTKSKKEKDSTDSTNLSSRLIFSLFYDSSDSEYDIDPNRNLQNDDESSSYSSLKSWDNDQNNIKHTISKSFSDTESVESTTNNDNTATPNENKVINHLANIVYKQLNESSESSSDGNDYNIRTTNSKSITDLYSQNSNAQTQKDLDEKNIQNSTLQILEQWDNLNLQTSDPQNDKIIKNFQHENSYSNPNKTIDSLVSSNQKRNSLHFSSSDSENKSEDESTNSFSTSESSQDISLDSDKFFNKGANYFPNSNDLFNDKGIYLKKFTSSLKENINDSYTVPSNTEEFFPRLKQDNKLIKKANDTKNTSRGMNFLTGLKKGEWSTSGESAPHLIENLPPPPPSIDLDDNDTPPSKLHSDSKQILLSSNNHLSSSSKNAKSNNSENLTYSKEPFPPAPALNDFDNFSEGVLSLSSKQQNSKLPPAPKLDESDIISLNCPFSSSNRSNSNESEESSFKLSKSKRVDIVDKVEFPQESLLTFSSNDKIAQSKPETSKDIKERKKKEKKEKLKQDKEAKKIQKERSKKEKEMKKISKKKDKK